MKFSAIIAIVVIALVASLAMVDATPVLDRRAPQPTAGPIADYILGGFAKDLQEYKLGEDKRKIIARYRTALVQENKELIIRLRQEKKHNIAIAKVDKMATKLHRAVYRYDALKIHGRYYLQHYNRYRKNQKALKKLDELSRKV
jgi:hypothetical protein